MTNLDDGTVAYTLIAQPCFEDLKQVAAQLAGLLVLEAAGSKSPDHPVRASAEGTYNNAVDKLRSARVTPSARKHHDHLLAAAGNLDEAMHGGGDPLMPLQLAYAHLRAASHALPGFQMISFELGCCAANKQSAQAEGPLCAANKK